MSDSTNRTFENAARANQDRLASELGGEFDYIVCGSGSSGSVVAGRLAANPDVSVLLIEAAGTDETEMVLDTDRWPMNLGGELDWSFFTDPIANISNVRNEVLTVKDGDLFNPAEVDATLGVATEVTGATCGCGGLIQYFGYPRPPASRPSFRQTDDPHEDIPTPPSLRTAWPSRSPL